MITYYTIQEEGRMESEFGNFLKRTSENTSLKGDAKALALFMKQLGTRRNPTCNIEKLFKGEDAAYRFEKNFEEKKLGSSGLRLYCLPMDLWRPRIIILFNGCLKTADKNHLCDNCRGHFNYASQLSKKITQAVAMNDIRIINNGTQLEVDEDFLL